MTWCLWWVTKSALVDVHVFPRERIEEEIPLWDFLVIEFGGLVEIKWARCVGAGNPDSGFGAPG